jgi:hypothetical protein
MSIENEILKQSTYHDWELGKFQCELCINYLGGCGCSKGVFIAFVGANLTHCHFFIKGQKCPKCGKRF